MTAQPDGLSGGPLAETTVGAIRAILALYDRRRLTLQVAIDEITALVDHDRLQRLPPRGGRDPTGPRSTRKPDIDVTLEIIHDRSAGREQP